MPKAPPIERKKAASDVAVTEILVVDAVLDREDQDLHDESEAEPGDRT